MRVHALASIGFILILEEFWYGYLLYANNLIKYHRKEVKLFCSN